MKAWYKNERCRYTSDLSDSQWAIIEPWSPRAGNRSKWEKRELVDAVLYFVENGYQWRNLPHDFPPHTTVSNFYRAAIRSGLWEKIRAVLVEQVRTETGWNSGIDGGKTKGRKRHIVVDTMGNLLVVVHATNKRDTKSSIWAAREAFKRHSSIRRFCADARYRKTFERNVSRELSLGIGISVRIKTEMGSPAQARGCWTLSGLAQQFPPPFQRL